MPNIVIEHASTIENASDLCECVHRAAMDSGLFDEPSVKVRAKAYDHYLVGGTIKNFVHVTVFLLDGRNLHQKKTLNTIVLKALQDMLGSNLSITVDCRDVVRATYAKQSGAK